MSVTPLKPRDDRRGAPAEAGAPDTPDRRGLAGWQLAALVAILLVAFGLRTAELAEVPRGLAHDEGIMGVMGREVAAGQSWQLFFPAYTGQEPLFIYVTAAAFKLLGANLFTLRLVSVGFGTLTVALAFALGRGLFGAAAGLWAAALTATTFWHVLASRSSYRSIAQPVFEALTIYLLWRGWQRRSAGWLLLAGVALGLTLYTYTAARLFPVAVAACLVILWLAAAGARRWCATRSLLLIGASVVTFAPLGYYFLRHPDHFIARAAQVSIASSYASQGPAWALLQSTLDSLGMYWLRGDPTYRFNLADRPVFEPVAGAAFALGGLICLWRWRRPAYLLPLAVTLVMMLPSALSAEDTPHFLRSNGVMPFIFVIAGLGFAASWRWLRAGPAARYALPLAALVVVADAVTTGYTYFGPWANARGTYLQLDTELVDAARYLQQVGGTAPAYISAIFPRYPSVAFLAPEQFERLRWLDGRECVVLDPDPRALYLFPASLGDPQRPGRHLLGPVETIQSGFGWPAFTVYRAANEPAIAQRTDATLDGRVRLLGVDLARRAAPGAVVPAVSYWQVLAPPGEEVRFFSHLVRDGGEAAGGKDFTCYYWTEWQGGEVLVAGHEFDLPPADEARYHLELGAYRAQDGERLGVADAAGRPAGDAVRAGSLLALRQLPSAPEPTSQLDARFDDGIRLSGATIGSNRQAGQATVTADLVWEATDRPQGDYTVFVQLLGPAGQVVAQADSQPRGGSAPTRVWERGDRWPDSYRLVAPALPPGEYALIAGLYDPSNGGKRLPVRGADVRGDYVVLARLPIAPAE